MSEQAILKRRLKRQAAIFLLSALITAAGCVFLATTASAVGGISIDFLPDDTGTTSFGVVDILLLFVMLTLIPSILLMMTSFTRIIIVLSLLRNALGTAQSPPNQVLLGLALFLTLFVMQPTLTEINDTAYQPYREGTYTAVEAVEAAVVPLKRFMLSQTTTKALNLYLDISGIEAPPVSDPGDIDSLTQMSLAVVVPAFITSELERAFIIGFLIYIPFLVIDIVISSVLMSMGMVMLPPATISLPFKILMFILVDGWNLVLGTIARGFM